MWLDGVDVERMENWVKGRWRSRGAAASLRRSLREDHMYKEVGEEQRFFFMSAAALICVGLTGLVGEIMWRQGSAQRRRKSIHSKRKKKITVSILTKRGVETLSRVTHTETQLLSESVLEKSIFQTGPKISYRHIPPLTSLWTQAHLFHLLHWVKEHLIVSLFLSSSLSSALNSELTQCQCLAAWKKKRESKYSEQ